MREKEDYKVNFLRYQDMSELPIYPFCAEISLRYIPRKVNRNQYPFLLICGIQEGSVRFVFDDRKITLNTNDVLLIPPYTPYYFESYSTGGHYKKLALELQGKLLNEYLDCLKIKQVCCHKKELWEEFISAFEKINEFNAAGNKGEIPEISAVIIRLLHQFSLRNQTENDNGDSLLLMACRWIDQNLDKPIDLRSLEQHLNVSRSTLGRIFRKGKTVSPKEYWIRRRLAKSEYLLNHSEYSIKEISFQLGYSSQFHFSNEFRRFYGLSPLAYRKLGQN